MNKLITTNLRVPENEWLQIRAMAAEEGMSANQYIWRIIKQTSIQHMINPVKIKDDYDNAPIWDIPVRMKLGKDEPMGLSKEDKTIYGL